MTSRTPEGESLVSPLRELVRAAKATRGQMSASQLDEGGRDLAARLARRRSGGGAYLRALLFSRRAPWLLAASLLLVLGGAGFAFRRTEPVILSYAIDGGEVTRSGNIQPKGRDELRMRFSDGSRVELSPGATASLRSIDAHGARLSLTEGRAHVDITHGSDARWVFDAGPFSISVTGTAFMFRWSADLEEFAVEMERGSVVIRGPLMEGDLALRAGQRLVVRVRERETLIRDVAASPAPAETSPTPAPDPSPAALGAPPPSAASKRKSPSLPPTDWPALLAAGKGETVVTQAQHRGIDACLAESSLLDLEAFADAARYGRHDELARRGLLMERRRFPLSSQARDAAFLLGRLDESGAETSGALEWYDRYLRETASGTYAAEALGRKMVLTQTLQGDEAARELAREYLRRFSTGAYAPRARELVEP